MSTTLEFFWHLSSADTKERLDSSVQIIGALQKFQAQFEPSTSLSANADANAELERRNAPDVAYAIKRLIRGLASPRESSRLGFSVALTELLSRIDTVDAGQLITLVLEASETTGAMKGQEERDMLFARLFGLTALAQSGNLVSTTSAATAEDFMRAVDALVGLGKKKSWLAESATWAMSRTLESLAHSSVDWRQDAAKRATKALFVSDSGGSEWTQETIALALQAQLLFPDLKWKKMLAPTFKDASILAVGSLASLSRIFKDGSVDDADDDSKQPATSGNAWKPQLHFVWDMILDRLYPVSSTPQVSNAPLQDFFRIVVDETYFATSASSERKYHGFLIFEKFVSRVPTSELPLLLTKNFMRTWINHLSHQDRYLHKIAKQVALTVQKAVSKEPRAGFALVLELLGRNGNRQFDQITRTKTVESILASMSTSGIREYVDYLLGQINDSDAVESDKRVWVLDQLSALIRNGSVPKDDDCIKTILDFFIVHGFFTIKKKDKSGKSAFSVLAHAPEPPFSAELQKDCRTRLLSALAELLTFTPNKKDKEGSAQARQPGYTQNGELWLRKAWDSFEELEKDTKRVVLVSTFSEEEQKLRKNTLDVISKIQNISEEHQDPAHGTQLLLIGGLWQEFTADDHRSREDFEDCLKASERLFARSKPKSKGKQKQPKDDDEHEPIDVLVNFIIGCLERGTAYSRAVATRAFEPLCSVLQASTVQLILSQLERRPPGQLVESQDEDEEMAEASDVSASEDGEESDEDVDNHEDSEDESDDSDDSVVVDDDDDDEAPDAELRSRIEEALRLSGVQPAAEEDSDDEIMNDDQMMQLDEHLADVFRLRKSEKGGAKQNINAQRDATHFKNRVLDLVDIYIRKQPTNENLPSVILPLLDLVTGTGQDEKQLQEKTSGILRSRLSKSKELPSLSDPTTTVEVYKQLHTRARKARSSQALAVISQCTIYVARLLQSSSGQVVIEEYGNSLLDYASRKNSALNTAFFLDFSRRLPSLAWDIRSSVLLAMEQCINFYRTTQLFAIFQSITSPVPPEQSQESLISLWGNFRKVLYQNIEKACNADPAPKPAQLKELLKVGHAAIRQSKRSDIPHEKFESIWDCKQLAEIVETLARSPRFKSAAAVQTQMRQMSNIFSSSAVAAPKKEASKRKAEETETVSKPHRKKVKKSSD